VDLVRFSVDVGTGFQGLLVLGFQGMLAVRFLGLDVAVFLRFLDRLAGLSGFGFLARLLIQRCEEEGAELNLFDWG
jgi:hypothetical protein